MLGKLVNKFKKHSLQENDHNNTEPQQNNYSYCRSATVNSFYSDNNSTLHDSGTESDDDELERLDCMSNREHPSDLMGDSPPNLTSSPPLLSEIDTNSWDSTGCESGIVIGDRDGDRDRSEEGSRAVLIESEFKVKSEGVSKPNDDTSNINYNTAGGYNCLHSSTNIYCKSKQINQIGAFRPITTTPSATSNILHDDSTQINNNNQNEQQQKGIITNNIGEKRRYENIASKTNNNKALQRHSPIVTRLRSYNNYINNEKQRSQRETLVACRRQPVKLLIHNPNINYSCNNLASQSSPYQPSKRGRLNCNARPCLDFDKMRERMVINSACGIGAQEFVESTIINSDRDNEKRRQEWSLKKRTCTGSLSTPVNNKFRKDDSTKCEQTNCLYYASSSGDNKSICN